ncbi:Mediator of RNA polymerase II transcription subunit 7 [Sparganum proliferum]
MNRPAEGPAHVSLFPLPPWQLINKYSDAEVAAGTAPPPPQIPASTSFRMFGTLFNTDDPVLKPLESDGMRRVYPQTYNRKLELKKLNFSILANYLDLLDVITRDPSSPRRTEKLEHLGILFVNMHHILNEYRPHQARDLVREMLRYQVDIARETVRRGEEYFARADETLRSAAQQLVVPGFSSVNKPSPPTSPSFADLGSELASFLTDLQADLKLSETKPMIPSGLKDRLSPDISAEQQSCLPLTTPPDRLNDDETLDLDPNIWSFLNGVTE